MKKSRNRISYLIFAAIFLSVGTTVVVPGALGIDAPYKEKKGKPKPGEKKLNSAGVYEKEPEEAQMSDVVNVVRANEDVVEVFLEKYKGRLTANGNDKALLEKLLAGQKSKVPMRITYDKQNEVLISAESAGPSAKKKEDDKELNKIMKQIKNHNN